MGDVDLKMNMQRAEIMFSMVSSKLSGRALSIASDAGAGIFKKAMIAKAPILSGATKRSIKVKKIKGKGGQGRVVGPSWKEFKLRKTKKGKIRIATKKTESQTFKTHIPGAVAHLVEWGYGSVGGHPWMWPAYKESRDEAQEKMKSKLWEEIRKAAQSANSKSK